MTSTVLSALLLMNPDAGPTPEAIRSAVALGLAPVESSAAEYRVRRDCFACHHQAVPALALSIAKARGFDVEEDALEDAADHAEADLRSDLKNYREGDGQPGGVTRAGYALLTLDVAGRPKGEVAEAVAGFFLRRDAHRGAWRTSSDRPPSESSTFTSTYLALRGLNRYGPEGSKDRVARAREWLLTAEAKDTEDRAFRLLALKEAGADEAALRAAVDSLVATRHDNGGWSQLDGGTPDAYATGSALAALHLAGGMATDSPVYRSGLRFLIAAQRGDGTWYVKSRSRPFQPYFESGFPYGKDQWISMAASSWSLAALALACPNP